jgi:hypothetical protein
LAAPSKEIQDKIARVTNRRKKNREPPVTRKVNLPQPMVVKVVGAGSSVLDLPIQGMKSREE